MKPFPLPGLPSLALCLSLVAAAVARADPAVQRQVELAGTSPDGSAVALRVETTFAQPKLRGRCGPGPDALELRLCHPGEVWDCQKWTVRKLPTHTDDDGTVEVDADLCTPAATRKAQETAAQRAFAAAGIGLSTATPTSLEPGRPLPADVLAQYGLADAVQLQTKTVDLRCSGEPNREHQLIASEGSTSVVVATEVVSAVLTGHERSVPHRFERLWLSPDQQHLLYVDETDRAGWIPVARVAALLALTRGPAKAGDLAEKVRRLDPELARELYRRGLARLAGAGVGQGLCLPSAIDALRQAYLLDPTWVDAHLPNDTDLDAPGLSDLLAKVRAR